MSDSESQPMPEDHRKAIHRVDGNRFWAVLIGINAYPSSPLRGCVNDVEDMKEFLTKDLGVPKDHIDRLLSPIPVPRPASDPSNFEHPEERYVVGDVTNPTRENIINTLLSLSTNPKIQHGDNIIIYFSGHGSSYDLKASGLYEPNDMSSVGTIEALCPVDRTAFCDISDREINAILTEISHAKGNHITLILDCCYSSGASRVPSQIRAATPLPDTPIKDMFSAAHTKLRKLSTYRSSVFDGNWVPDMNSHVVLAACQETEFAKEEGADNRCNGIFTWALIKALKSEGLNEESTYADLFSASNSEMPPGAYQKPMFAGDLNARLWYQPKMTKKVSKSSWSRIAMLAWLVSGAGVVLIAYQFLGR